MNYKIEPLSDGVSLKIDARIYRNGKEYRKRETIKGTRRTAERRATQIIWDLEDRAEKDDPSRSLTTFGECVKLYRARKEIKPKDETYIKRLEADLSDLELTNMSEGLNRFIDLLSRSRTRRGTYYAPGTLNRYQQWVRAILNFAVDWGFIDDNPIKKLRKFKETPRDISLSQSDVHALLESIKKYRPYLLPIVTFSLQIPSRLSELTEAKVLDVDLENRILRIRNGKTKNGLGINKPIPPNLLSYFEELPRQSEWVFFRKVKSEYRPLKNFNKAWRFVCEQAGLPNDLRFHDLRHYSATELIHKGLSEREVMQVAGWKTNMLSTYYHRDGLGAAKAVFDALNE